ncbi:MAG: outer membrane protein assembly factor BamE [Nitrospiraceae bacterium]
MVRYISPPVDAMLNNRPLSHQSAMVRNLIVLTLLILPGCSVVMALSGKPEPRFEQLQVGMPREEVETILGPPAEVVTTKEGNQTAIYVYQRGNERSILRAVIHLFMDIITLGFWEIPATAAEGSQGEERRFPIVYGPDGTVLLLNEYGNLS